MEGFSACTEKRVRTQFMQLPLVLAQVRMKVSSNSAQEPSWVEVHVTNMVQCSHFFC